MAIGSIIASILASLAAAGIKSGVDASRKTKGPDQLPSTPMPDWMLDAIKQMRENRYTSQDISKQQMLTRGSMKDTATKARKGLTAQSYGSGLGMRQLNQMSTDAGLQVEQAVSDISNRMRSVNQQNAQALLGPGAQEAQRQSGQAAAMNLNALQRADFQNRKPTGADFLANIGQAGANAVGQYAVMQQQEESEAKLMELFKGPLSRNQMQGQGVQGQQDMAPMLMSLLQGTSGDPTMAGLGAGQQGQIDTSTLQGVLEWLLASGFHQRQPGQAFNLDPRTAVR